MKRKAESQCSSDKKAAEVVPSDPREKWREILRRYCPREVSDVEAERQAWAEELEQVLYQAHIKDVDVANSMKNHIQLIAINLKRNPLYLATFSPSQIGSMTSAELGNKPWYVKDQCEEWRCSVMEVIPGLSPRSAWNVAGRDCQLFLIVQKTRSTLVDLFNDHFKDIPRVSTVVANILDLDGGEQGIEAFVSPANSYGNMDGGIDKEYAEHFGWPYGRPYDSINPLQQQIDTAYGTEKDLPIGDALIVPVVAKKDGANSRSVRHLIAAPTMTRPEALAIGSRNVYLASLATFREWRRHNEAVRNNRQQGEEILRVAMPLFGTGVGAMPAIIAIKQMHEAFIDAWT